MLASGQSPKGYTALHRGQLAGAASTLWEHVTINMDMRKKAGNRLHCKTQGINIGCMPASGPLETCRRTLRLSAYRGRPEVTASR
jgi:hypothetical protein